MVVVGLGPAGPDLLTAGTVAAIARVDRRYLRTSRHPSAAAVPSASSFDHLYETASSIDDVYAGIVEALAEAAAGAGEVLYAVPGSPSVAERSVELLRADDRVAVETLPALSFTDLAWDRLGIDPLAAGARLVDGRRFAVEAAGERGPLLVAQCDSRQVLSDVKLVLGDAAGRSPAASEPDGGPVVTVLFRLGLADEEVRSVAWAELDRDLEPDHLTSLYIPRLAEPLAGEVVRFEELVRDLRSRCPWDREQTHASLTRHLLEEAYEVLEAIAGLPGDDAYDHLEEELGDLLFQVVFHSTLAAEEGRFTLADVARGVHDKLVHRHPHVFGTVRADTAGEVLSNWERIKKAEKGRASLMDGIPPDLPALLYAAKVQRKAASVGLDLLGGEPSPSPAGGEAGQPAGGEAGQSPAGDRFGQVLFSAADAARVAGVDPEAALRATASTFRRRFEALERLAADEGLDLGDLDLSEKLRLWNAARGCVRPE